MKQVHEVYVNNYRKYNGIGLERRQCSLMFGEYCNNRDGILYDSHHISIEPFQTDNF